MYLAELLRLYEKGSLDKEYLNDMMKRISIASNRVGISRAYMAAMPKKCNKTACTQLSLFNT